MNVSPRWWLSLPFLLALLVLVFLGWAVSVALVYPYDGLINRSGSGLIKEIDPTGPAANLLQVGDTIVQANGVLVYQANPLHGRLRAGDLSILQVRRGETTMRVMLRLQEPSLQEEFNRLAPLFLALIFWGIGVGVQAFKPSREAGNPTFLFFEVSAAFLIAGATSALGPSWVLALYYLLLWTLGPIAVHFHLHFPQDITWPGRRFLLASLYSLSLFGGLPYLIWGPVAVNASSYASFLVSASRIFLALNLTLVVSLLAYSYRHAATSGVRGKVRILLLGGFLGLFPLVPLMILPDALIKQTLIPYSYTFLFLAVFPLTYGYAIFRHRLIEIERHVNRGATIILVYSVLGAVYLIVSVVLTRLFSESVTREPLVNTLLVLFLATIFVPLHRNVQHIVDKVFYGGWYDYRSAITQITQGLEQLTNLNSLAATLSERLVKTLRLEESCVFLSDLDGAFSIVQVAPVPPPERHGRTVYTPLPRSSLSYLLNVGGVVERNVLRESLKDVKISPEEYQLLNSEQVYLWVPVVGHGEVIGLLALGPKFGGDVFSGEDMDILRVVARQMGPLIENIHLVTRLRRYAAELEQRVVERTEELAAAKKRVEAILASVGEGVIVTDLEGRILTVNTAYEDQSGYRQADLIGREIWGLYKGAEVEKFAHELRNTLQNERTWSGELLGCRKDGSQYDVQMTFASLRDENNRIVGYVGSQRDITQQKELDRMKDLFVSDVSHELRTPTTNISLYLELLESAPEHKRSEYLSVLREQTTLLRKLVEDILDLSRLTIGKARKIEFTDVDLNALTEQVVMAHLPLAEANGLALEFHPAAELPPIWGEPNQLARVINNLVANAIHYTQHGGVHLRTYTDHEEVCLEVADTGMGIDVQDQAHIFERFYRGWRVRQTNIHGTGLGLAIVKEIMDLHDSKIAVESEVGRGSKFTLRFPLQVKQLWQEKIS